MADTAGLGEQRHPNGVAGFSDNGLAEDPEAKNLFYQLTGVFSSFRLDS
jgi:hypothetical protein